MQFAQEHWRKIEPEIAHLARMHWQEVAVNKDRIKLDLDCGLYRALDDNGSLHITTARVEGELVGYYAMVVRTHPHYRTTVFGFLDSYFLLPEYRNVSAGLELFEAMESAMKKAGAVCLISGFKLHNGLAPVFDRLGWTPIETMYSKYIGDK